MDTYQMAAKQKPVRLMDIAKAADVSISTVSLALADHPRIGEDTKRRLRQLSRELGYRRTGEGDRRARPVEQSTRRGGGKASYSLGCLVVGSTLQDEVYMELLDGLASRATAIDARMELGSVDADASPDVGLEQAMRFAERLNGVIVTGLVSAELLDALEKAHLPYVVLGHSTVDPGEPVRGLTQTVGFDELAMGRYATRSLLKAGHSRVAFASEVSPKNLWNDRWLMGYRVAHLDLGVPCDERLIHTSTPVYAGMAGAVGDLCQLDNPPTAFVVPNARVAREVHDELRNRGVQVAPDRIVMGSGVDVAKRHGVAHLGRIEPDPRTLACVAFDHLVRLCEQPATTPLEITVPFTAHNLPGAGVSK